MIALDVTTDAVDKRMAKPADLVALSPSLSTEDARHWVDVAGASAVNVLGREPWRAGCREEALGKGGQYLLLSRWPIEEDPPVVSTVEGTALDSATYSVKGRHRHSLYRRNGWEQSGVVEDYGGHVVQPSQTFAYSVPYTAGWLMPGQVGTWTASTAYVAVVATTSAEDPANLGNPYARGSWVRSADPRVVLRFECTKAGTTGATEPPELADSATEPGDEITDGSVTWTARRAFELPADLSRAVLNLAAWLASPDGRAARPVKRREASDSEIEFFEGAPSNIMTAIEAYR